MATKFLIGDSKKFYVRVLRGWSFIFDNKVVFLLAKYCRVYVFTDYATASRRELPAHRLRRGVQHGRVLEVQEQTARRIIFNARIDGGEIRPQTVPLCDANHMG